MNLNQNLNIYNRKKHFFTLSRMEWYPKTRIRSLRLRKMRDGLFKPIFAFKLQNIQGKSVLLTFIVLLTKIQFCENCYTVSDGKKMLIFRKSKQWITFETIKFWDEYWFGGDTISEDHHFTQNSLRIVCAWNSVE